MKTIVVPLDGSPYAQAAVRPAVAFAACTTGTDVLLITCVDRDREEDQVQTYDYLDGQAERFDSIVDVTTRVIHEGTPANAILSTLSESAESTLCMASRGRSGLRTAVLGSVAADVVARSTRPMIIVGPACRSVLLPGERGDMLVCSDGSAFSDAIMPAAATWARNLGLTPWLVEVVPPDETAEHGDEPPRNREVEAGMNRLRRLAAEFDGGGPPPRIETLHGHAPTAIYKLAERRSASLVALATHGRSGLATVGLGSVAREIIRRSPCPSLLMRPDT